MRGDNWFDGKQRCCKTHIQAFGRKEYVPIPTRAGVRHTTRQYAMHYEWQKQDGHPQHSDDAGTRIWYDSHRVSR